MDPRELQALKNGVALSAGIDHENHTVDVSAFAQNIRDVLVVTAD